MTKNNPPMWPSVIAWPLALIAAPFITIYQRIRHGEWR